MSEFTFNIADYRPLERTWTQDRGPAVTQRNGFVVLSSNSEPRKYEYESEWLDARPVVVDIRSLRNRESHRSIPRRGKVLRFSNPASHRVYTMPPQHDTPVSSDDDPGPLVA